MYTLVPVSIAAVAIRLINAQSLNALPDCAVSFVSLNSCRPRKKKKTPLEEKKAKTRFVSSARGRIRQLCAVGMRVFRPPVHLQRHRLPNLHPIRNRAEMRRR